MPVIPETPRPLSPEDVATVPQPGLVQPVDFQFSPDDTLITFLHSPDRSRTRQLVRVRSRSRASAASFSNRLHRGQQTRTSPWKRPCAGSAPGSGAPG